MLARLKKLFKKKEVVVPVVIKPRVRPASIWVNQPRRVDEQRTHQTYNDDTTDLLMAALVVDSLSNKNEAQPQYEDFVGNGGNFSGGGASDSWSYDTNTNTSNNTSSSNDNYSSSSSDSYSSSDSSSSSSSSSD